jgi:hypothetical protein
LGALAGLADPRAVRWIREVLELEDPAFLHSWLGGLNHQQTLDMLPLLRTRMRDFAGRAGKQQVNAIAQAIGKLGPAGVGAVSDLAELLPGLDQPWSFVVALGRIGPGARDALPAVRSCLSHSDHKTALAAAEACWLIAADPQPALDAIAHAMASDVIYRQRDAAQVAAKLGAHAGSVKGQLERMAAATPDRDPGAWSQTHAAIALWHVGAEPQPTVGLLLDAAERNEVILETAVPCFAAMGALAADALGLLQRKLADPMRHRTHSFDSMDPVRDDIVFQASCREAIDRITG